MDRDRLIKLVARFDALDDPRLDDETRKISKEFAENLRQGKCGMCGATINLAEFRDSASWEEFKLSHLCQTCQDVTFR